MVIEKRPGLVSAATCLKLSPRSQNIPMFPKDDISIVLQPLIRRNSKETAMPKSTVNNSTLLEGSAHITHADSLQKKYVS